MYTKFCIHLEDTILYIYIFFLFVSFVVMLKGLINFILIIWSSIGIDFCVCANTILVKGR